MKQPVIFFPLLSWDSELIHRDQMLAREFVGMGSETYFIDRITRKPWRFLGGIHKRTQDGVCVVSVFALPYFQGRIKLIYKINDYLIARQLDHLLRDISSTATFFVSNPDWAYIVKSVKPNKCKIIYDISDDYVALAKNIWWQKVVRKYEAMMVEIACAFVLTTRSLVGKIDTTKPYYIVSNGVDLNGFEKAKRAVDKEGYDHVAGFIGGIYEWVDLGLVEMAARTYPKTLFVLIGPSDQADKIDQLLDNKNVRYLGAVPKKQIADYFASLDVGLVPFVSETIYPRLKTVDSQKIYQYIYFGYPVVATDFEQVRNLGNQVKVAHTRREFIDKLGSVLEGGKTKAVKRDFGDISWHKKAEELTKFIKSIK